MAWLSVNNISKIYGTIQVLAPVSLSFQQGKNLAIAGETGSGKSTLLKIIGGHVQTDSGEVLFEGQKVLGPMEQLLPGHKHIAYLSQHFELRNNYIVFDLLDYGSELDSDEAAKLYAICQIDHLLSRKTNSGLSGGERQRIALAKLLSTKPKLLLLDEPFSNLDALHKKTIKQVLHTISQQLGITIIMVSHDAIDTLSWADEIIIMKNGEIVQHGSPQQVYFTPANPYAAGLLGECNQMPITFFPESSIPKYKDASGEWLLIRPSQLQLVSANEPGALACEVQAISFSGAYYLLKIQHQLQNFQLQLPDVNVQLGETVFVQIKTQHSF